MAYKKITADDLAGVGVLGQPDVPGLSARDMQLAVEGIPREVIIPRFNRLVDEVTARDENTYTKEETDQALAAGGISVYDHEVIGTVHKLTGSGSNVKLNPVADWKPGDTMTVNGYPAYPYNHMGENISGEVIFKKHTPVFFFAEFTEGRYNCFFKMGGGGSSGLTDEELAKATAATGDVLQGKTFYAGDKTLKTGTMTSHPAGTNVVRLTRTDINVHAYIPQGAYVTPSGAGYPEILMDNRTVASVIGLRADKIVKGKTILGIEGTGGASGATGEFISGQNEATFVETGFKPKMIMLYYTYYNSSVSPAESSVTIIFDAENPGTYKMASGNTPVFEAARENKDGGTHGYITVSDTGFSFKGYYNLSGGRTVRYVCY